VDDLCIVSVCVGSEKIYYAVDNKSERLNPYYPAKGFTGVEMSKFSSSCYHIGHKESLELYMEQMMSDDQQCELAWEHERQTMAEKCGYNTLDTSEMDEFDREFQKYADALHKCYKEVAKNSCVLCGVCRRPFNTISPDDQRKNRFTPKWMEGMEIPKWKRAYYKHIPGKDTCIHFHIIGFGMLACYSHANTCLLMLHGIWYLSNVGIPKQSN